MVNSTRASLHYYVVPISSSLNAFPGSVPFRVSHAFDLLEARDCVTHVGAIMDGFFALLGKREMFVHYTIAAGFIDLRHAF